MDAVAGQSSLWLVLVKWAEESDLGLLEEEEGDEADEAVEVAAVSHDHDALSRDMACTQPTLVYLKDACLLDPELR